MNRGIRWVATAGAAGAATYATYAGITWLRYGRVGPRKAEDADPALDRFIPTYEAVDRHRIRVQAPAAMALRAACDLNLQSSPILRAIFRARERILGGKPNNKPVPSELLAMVTAMGWRVLAEIPDREVVVGSVTQPWAAEVVFRPIPADEFRDFQEPGWVKIAWTLRADAVGADDSIALTETRVATTDPIARAKFRRYWAFFSPGIALIRRIALRRVKQDAERRVREVSGSTTVEETPGLCG
jgi:hypothetical protein